MRNVPIDTDLEIVIIAALRYAIPRETYACQTIADFIENNWNELTTHAQHNIHEDIREFYSESFLVKHPWSRIIKLKIDDKNSPTN